MTCAKQTTIAVVVKDGKFWVGSNKCSNPQAHCPRDGMKTGEGYERCKNICRQEHHAEVAACVEAGENARGADLYLIGHYYCCDDCRRVMAEYGIKNVFIFNSRQPNEPIA